jgi:cytochrome d ubiquinol oxidase subunit II
MHGALYVVVKTEGDLQEQARGWAQNATIFFILTYVVTTMVTLLYVDRMTAAFKERPYLFLIPLLNVLAIANVPRALYHRKDREAFLSSAAAIALLMALFGVGMYPYLIYSRGAPQYSLTIENAASTQTTLWIMLIIAIIGMPLVMAYTFGVHWVFRGKVKLEATSY